MSGRQEITKKFLDLINVILDNSPEYMTGFSNFMSDSSIKTKYYYINHVNAFMKYTNKNPEALLFDDFSNYMTEITYKEDGSKTSSSYQINIYSSLKKFCEYLYVTKRLSENYMLYIKRPKAKDSQETIIKREKGYLTERELKRYIRNVEIGATAPHRVQSVEWDIRDKAIILTFLCTGIRNSALRTIDVQDVDLKKKTLVVTDKGEHVRIFDIPDSLCEAIAEWLECRETIMKGYHSQALFVSRRKNRMDSGTVLHIVKRYADKVIDDKNITPHKLRATYGTQLYNKTGDIYFVQECMGHSNPKVTELYIRDKKQNTKRAGDIMDNLL